MLFSRKTGSLAENDHRVKGFYDPYRRLYCYEFTRRRFHKYKTSPYKLRSLSNKQTTVYPMIK